MKKIVLGLITAVGFATTSANAATLDFDNNGSSYNQASFGYSVDGISVTATAGLYSTPGAVGSALTGFSSTTIDLNGWGLISQRHSNDEHVVDGRYGNEIILFDFGSKVVELTDARFRWTSGYDFLSSSVFDFFADGIFIGQSTYAGASTLFDGVTGSVFGIGASHRRTGFKLAGISFEEVSAVPLPASSLLLLAGVGGLAAMRRKQK